MTQSLNNVKMDDPNSKKKQNPGKMDGYMGKKNQDMDMSIFTQGLDLTSFGLNLTESEKIFPNFGSPFAENPTRKIDPQNFGFPQCYLKISSTLAKPYFKKFPDETLLYIFYNHGDDKERLNAVEELYSRNWKYHPQTETWILEQEGVKKYFELASWQTKPLLQEIKEEEILTLNDFKI